MQIKIQQIFSISVFTFHLVSQNNWFLTQNQGSFYSLGFHGLLACFLFFRSWNIHMYNVLGLEMDVPYVFAWLDLFIYM